MRIAEFGVRGRACRGRPEQRISPQPLLLSALSSLGLITDNTTP